MPIYKKETHRLFAWCPHTLSMSSPVDFTAAALEEGAELASDEALLLLSPRGPRPCAA